MSSSLLSLLASLLALALGVLTGLLFAHLGLHDTSGIIASAIAGLVIAAVAILPLVRKVSK